MDETKILFHPYWLLLAAFCLPLGAVLFTFLWSQPAGAKNLPLPPQPKGSLILGNLWEVITESKQSLQHLLMQRWAREHGEVVRVRLGPVTEYFLNSDRSVKVSEAERRAFVSSFSDNNNSWLFIRKSWIAHQRYHQRGRAGLSAMSLSATS